MKGQMKLLAGSAQQDRLGSIAMYTGITVKTWHCWEGFQKLESTAKAEDSPDGIDSQRSMTKARLQIGGYQLGFDLEMHRICQVYLHKIWCAWMNIPLVSNPDMWRELVMLSYTMSIPIYGADYEDLHINSC